MKPLERNIRETLQDIGIGNNFQTKILKVWESKVKIERITSNFKASTQQRKQTTETTLICGI